ncbi:MAG TPA: nuclear transport factor 2 family protein [Nocardioidaceae bacterium]|nr:nuclear transport factor 2 family protein [Nocardioidaceae bacterium]
MATVPAPLRFSIDHWAAFWSHPHPDLAVRMVTPDVIAYWPGQTEPARGVRSYRARVAQLLERAPNLRLDVVDHAYSDDDLLFVHWVAHGGDERRTVHGVDRIRLRDGRIKEIRAFYDPARFASLVDGSLR